MNIMLYLFLLLILSGCLTGFLAGLLGIGGGIIIVPVLAFVFHQLPQTADSYMQFAAGTSLGIMIFTTFSSIPHKLRVREVNLTIVKMLVPWIISMNVLGAIIVRFLNPKTLSILFACLMLFMFSQMLLKSHKVNETPKRNGRLKSAFWGSLVGIKSGFFGIGGGIVTIPYIHSLGYSIRIAIGTSSLFTLVIAITGSVSFIVTGYTENLYTPWSLGYLYLPAIICVVPTSMIFSKLGAKFSSKTSSKTLKITFLAILLIVSIKMLWIALL